MNVVFQSENLTVVDDRDFISISDAIDLLISGESISVCDPPDYGAESEFNIHSCPVIVTINDIIDLYQIKLSGKELRSALYEYLRGYELAR